jgi:hypothetical protein
MTRTRQLMLALAALALLAAAAPGPAAARSRAVKVALPSPGDITLAHVVFKRSAARSRRLPRFRLVSRSTRRLLRRYGVGVLGGSIRLSRRRVVGSVLLLRKRPRRGRILIPPPGAAALVATDGRVQSVVVERNAIADLRREKARAAGEEANAPTACGETGLFTLLSGDTLPRGGWSFGLYYNNWDRLIDFDEPPPNYGEAATLMLVGYGIACGFPERFEDTPFEVAYDDFVFDLGAPPPVTCNLFTTFIGSATDSEGHVLTQPIFQVRIRCGIEIDGVLLGVEDKAPTRCADSAGHQCVIQGGAALFPFTVPAFQDRSFSIETDPALMRGDAFRIEIDTREGNVRELDVM